MRVTGRRLVHGDDRLDGPGVRARFVATAHGRPSLHVTDEWVMVLGLARYSALNDPLVVVQDATGRVFYIARVDGWFTDAAATLPAGVPTASLAS